MGKDVLNSLSIIESINLNMPNIHNVPFQFEKFGLVNKDLTGKPFIFIPMDEPHGIVQVRNYFNF